MTHLQYSPTKGALSAKVKDNILDLMFKKSVGYLTAAEKLHIHPARAFAELRADKDFKALVEEAREVIAERLQDEYIALSDEPATSRDAVANKTLRLKARWQVISSLLVRFNRSSGGTPNRLSGSVQVFNQQIILTPEQQEQLRSDRRALEAQANRLYPIEDAVIVNTESTPEGVARQDNGLQDPLSGLPGAKKSAGVTTG
jgi:hypothetical protein